MKTYGHLRDHYSAVMAGKVTFSKATPENQVSRKASGQP
jgi:hypothetical protein